LVFEFAQALIERRQSFHREVFRQRAGRDSIIDFEDGHISTTQLFAQTPSLRVTPLLKVPFDFFLGNQMASGGSSAFVEQIAELKSESVHNRVDAAATPAIEKHAILRLSDGQAWSLV